MKQSFVKTIEGHEAEFVRLLYPLRYNVFLRIVNANPMQVTLKKDGQGVWNLEEQNDLPGWVNEITLPMQEAIEENEANAASE